MPDNLEELINRWNKAELPDLSDHRKQKNHCAWCEKVHINQTYQKYLLKGNICERCSAIINEKIKNETDY